MVGLIRSSDPISDPRSALIAKRCFKLAARANLKIVFRFRFSRPAQIPKVQVAENIYRFQENFYRFQENFYRFSFLYIIMAGAPQQPKDSALHQHSEWRAVPDDAETSVVANKFGLGIAPALFRR